MPDTSFSVKGSEKNQTTYRYQASNYLKNNKIDEKSWKLFKKIQFPKCIKSSKMAGSKGANLDFRILLLDILFI